MFKIKHERTADCVVAGYRLHKSVGQKAVRSVRCCSGSIRMMANWRPSGSSVPSQWPNDGGCSPNCSRWSPDFDGHPWNWAAHEAGERTPRKNEFSRWNAGKDLSFVPLRPERVVEVRYDHMEGRRFRHTAQFNRWRPDRDPRSCGYEQLEQPLTFSLTDIVPGLVPGNAQQR